MSKANNLIRCDSCPYFINKSTFRRAFFYSMIGFPRADFQKSEHVHAVDIIEPPTGIEECIVGGIDVIVQRQFSRGTASVGVVSVVASAAFVGKSDRTSVVCV